MIREQNERNASQHKRAGSTGPGQNIDNLDNDLNIEQELRDIIEDSEDEETAMPLRFTDPNELMEILSTLEEKNLFMIELCQNVEMQFEERKQWEKHIKSTFTAEIETLRANEEQNNKRIEKS